MKRMSAYCITALVVSCFMMAVAFAQPDPPEPEPCCAAVVAAHPVIDFQTGTSTEVVTLARAWFSESTTTALLQDQYRADVPVLSPMAAEAVLRYDVAAIQQRRSC